MKAACGIGRGDPMGAGVLGQSSSLAYLIPRARITEERSFLLATAELRAPASPRGRPAAHRHPRGLLGACAVVSGSGVTGREDAEEGWGQGEDVAGDAEGWCAFGGGAGTDELLG